MARTKNKNAPEIVSDNLPQEVVDVVSNAQNTHSVADKIILDATDAILKAGELRGIEFMKRVSDVAIAQIFSSLSNSKGYIGIPYKDADGNLKHVSDFEEFCQAFFSKSYRRCYELSKNLQLLGTELYEQAELIGFRARDYQALKALPADDQAIIKQAIETEDRETVIDLMKEMSLKNLKKLEELHFRATDAEENCEANAQIVATVRAENDQLKQQLAAAKRRIKTMTADEAEKELRREAATVAFDAEVSLTRDLREVCNTMLEFAEQNGTDYRGYLAGMIRHLELKLIDLRQEFDLPDNANPEDFSWLGKEVLDSIQPE